MKKIGMALVAGCLMTGALPASASEPVARYECFGKTARPMKPNRRGVVRGTRRNDVIIVLRRDVIVIAGDGNDRICTGGGDDSVAAGDGHDFVYGGRGRDLLGGGEGDDYLGGAGGEDRLKGGYGSSDTLVGGYGDDDLIGGTEGSGSYLFGGSGVDRLVGGGGPDDGDLLMGGEGHDVLEGRGGSDTASYAHSEVAVRADLAAGTSSEDVLSGIENIHGSVFDDVLTGDASANRLNGDDGNDILVGGAGNDYVDGGAGPDSSDGGDGADVLSFLGSPVGVTADLETGSATEDEVESFIAFEHLIGSEYDDELSGDGGTNDLFGSRGSDALFGRAGDDDLHSGSSGDAGPGDDTCWDSGGAIANCEQDLHGDPPAYSTITTPTQASSIPVARFKEITGTASAGAFGPEPKAVQIALRRMSASGCYWWNVKRGAMQPGHCGRPFWVDADFDDGQGTWSRRVPSPVQLLNPGRYQVRSRIHQPGYTEAGFFYNLVDFRLL